MSTPGSRDTEASAQYHRGELPRRIAAVSAGVLVAAAIVGGMFAIGLSAPEAAVAGSVVTTPTPESVPTGEATLAAIDATASSEPEAASSPVPRAATSTLASTGPAEYRIAITATGYQTEIDECQWVRMDLLPTLPIVGAHTRCGGAIVLKMNSGDEVELSGQGLDGDYRVGESRDAHAGDLAETATAGMVGSVVLQTCYPGTDGRERLVALIPAVASGG